MILEGTFLLVTVIIVILILFLAGILRELKQQAMIQSEKRLEKYLQYSFDSILILDQTGKIQYMSPSFCKGLGDLYGQNISRFFECIHQEDLPKMQAAWTTSLSKQGDVLREEFKIHHADGTLQFYYVSISNHLDDPNINGVIFNFYNVSTWKRVETVTMERVKILQRIVKGEKLESILDNLIEIMEKHHPETIFSILLLNEEGILRQVAGARLSHECIEGIGGITVGPTSGLCGTAAYRKETVIVSDIAADPLMGDYRETALKHGLRAGYATPLFSGNNEVFGTFSCYSPFPQILDQETMESLEPFIHLASIAISHSIAEETIRTSETRYRLIAENSSDLILVVDRYMEAIYASPSHEKTMGLTIDSGSHPIEFVHPEDTSLLIDRHLKCLNEKLPVKVEYRIRAVNGNWIYLESNAMPVLDENDEVQSLVIVSRDISERKKAEMILTEKEEHYRLMFEHNPNPMCVFDIETLEFLAVNNATLQHYGYTEEEFLSMTMRDIRPIEDIPVIMEIKRENAWGDDSFGKTWRHKKKDGTLIYVEINTQGMNFFGRSARMVMINDVTQRIQVEDELKEARDTAINALNIKSAFLANMSHEIRTPLNAIIGMAELLQETALTDQQKRYTDICKKACSTLRYLVNDILDITKIEAGQISLEEAEFSLDDLTQDILNLLERSFAKKGISLSLDIDEGASGLYLGDSNRLQQVLLNLIGNSLKFTEIGGVYVRVLKEDEERLLFEVVDTGIGIPLDQHVNIFEPFFQLAPQGYGGIGLGLTISKKILESMGGRIWLEPHEDKGTTFRFTLPLLKSNHNYNEVPEQKEMIWDQRELSILIVDDAKDNRLLLKAYLRDTPCLIEEAENGESALEKIKTKNFDFILMDIQMPMMDGYTATKAIRDWERTRGNSQAVIIALTAFAFPEDRLRCLEAGCDSYLSKPVTKHDLLTEIHKHTGMQKIIVQVDLELKELIPEFLINREKEVSILRNLLENKELEKIRILGHSMKGFGSGYGFNFITIVGQELERAAEKQDMQTIEALLVEYAKYLNSIRVEFPE